MNTHLLLKSCDSEKSPKHSKPFVSSVALEETVRFVALLLPETMSAIKYLASWFGKHAKF